MTQTRVASNDLIAAGFKFQPGSASIAPAYMQAGTLLTTPAAGALEYDGTCFYATPQASSRGLVTTEYFIIQNAANTLLAQTAYQPIFNASPSGSLANLTTGTYAFEGECYVTGLSATSGSIGFAVYSAGGQSAVYGWSGLCGKGAAGITVGPTATWSTNNSTALCTANTGVCAWFRVRGSVRATSNAVVNITPCISMTTAIAAVIQPGTFFRVWPLGNDNVVQCGGWT